MKLKYGVLLAMLMAGNAVAEQDTTSGLPQAEKTSKTNAAGSTITEAQTSAPAAEATAQPAMATEAVTTADEQTGFSRGSVARSMFTTSVDNREPIDDIKQLSADNQRVYFYTELRDMAGQTAKHRWEFNGEVMAEVEFNVKGPRWRVWSSKSFVPKWTGDWKVSVLNGANEVISEELLNYVPSAETGAEMESAAPTEAAPVQ